MTVQCGLCSKLSVNPFCCLGCETVYSILKERGGLGLDEIPEEKPEQVIRLRFEIEDLFCLYCKDVIEWVLQRTSGIAQVLVDYSTDICIVDYDPRKISEEEVYQKIRTLRYTPKSFEVDEKKSSLQLRLCIAAFFSFNIMMFSYPVLVSFFDESYSLGPLFAWLSFFFSLPLLTYAGIPIFKRALVAGQRGFFGMEALVTIGVFSSFILSSANLFHGSMVVYFDTMGVIITFVLLGKWMEGRAKSSAKTQMKLLFKSIPKRVRVNDQFILIKELRPDDLITALCGEKIGVDGCVEEGQGWLDASLLTGESEPIFVEKGSLIRSGSILIEGLLKYRMNKGKSTLESIVEMVEGSLLKKEIPKTTYFSYFVPSVCLLALFSPDPLSVLLISCPCAIGIAAPLAESKLMDRLLLLGVIVRNRAALRFLGKEAFFVFDKTGTLTTKEWDLKSDLGGYESTIKTLSLHSTHPIAKALKQGLETVPKIELEEIKEVRGEGIVGEGRYFLGSPKWLGIQEECSIAFLEQGKKPIAIHLEDRIKNEAKELLLDLKDVQLFLYSGDRHRKTSSIANQLDIKNFAGDLTPLQKKEKIEALKKEGIVAFVGDGINDAAAIAAADLSFVPMNGSDLTSQAADFLLTKEDLRVISAARRAGRLSFKIRRQNLFWAFFYNMLGIPLAFFGLLNPVVATLFMVISSLMVLFNSKRI